MFDPKYNKDFFTLYRIVCVRNRSTCLLICGTLLIFTLFFLSLYQILLLHNVHGQPMGAGLIGGFMQRRSAVWVTGKRIDSGHLHHVFAVFGRLGYQRVDGTLTGAWDVMWAHDYPFRTHKDYLQNLQPHQKVNHFPGSGYFTSKLSLVTAELTHTPQAFKIPDQVDQLKRFAAANPDIMWVQKSNSHRGVLIKPLGELDLTQNNTFIQKYVDQPLLIDGRRFDIGLYVVLTSVDPLRIYVNEGEWLVRFCPNKYYPFDKDDVDKYVIGDDYMPVWDVPSLKRYYQDLDMNRKYSLITYLKTQGKDVDFIHRQMLDAILEVFLKMEDNIISASRKYNSMRNFFEMVRFDFIINEELRVFLMEVNMSPNLSTGHFTQNKLLYEQVVYGLLNLVGVGKSTQQDFRQSSEDGMAMIVSSRDLHTFHDKCGSDMCEDTCKPKFCQMCSPCLKRPHVISLEDSYREHLNRGMWRRVFPKPFLDQQSARTWKHGKDTFFNSLNSANQWQSLWFLGRCLHDVTWCK